VARLLEYDAWLRAHLGDGDGALRSCQAIVNAGRSIGDEPLAISQLIRIASRGVAVRQVERTLALSQPSEPALLALQQLLEKEQEHPMLLTALKGERAMGEATMQAILDGKLKTAGLFDRELATEGKLLTMIPRYVIQSRIDLLRHNTECVEIARLPADRQPAEFAKWEAKARDLPRLAKLLCPSMSRIAVSCGRSQAQLASAAAALAAERYRLKHGHWPAAVQELAAAGFLREVPLDPFGGKPLRVGTFDGGIVLYSVGADGVDHGGTLPGKRPDGRPLDEKETDVGLRLWDVTKRRQAPPQPPLPLEAPAPAGQPGSGR
jgi:hypothetical protein